MDENKDGVTDGEDVTRESVAPPVTADGPALPEGLPFARVRDCESRGQAWERLRQEARTAGMTRRDSVTYAGREVDRLCPLEDPPPEPEAVEPEPADVPPLPENGNGDHLAGLGDLPRSWPELPDNASLQAEVSWTQANRVRVRDGAGVDLSRARSPAPSLATLSWLETAILFPAKWADITARATAHAEDDAEAVRRERGAVGDVSTLLDEMATT